MMGVQIRTTPAFRAGFPEELSPDQCYRRPMRSRSFDVSPIDGRLLMLKEISDEDAAILRTELMPVENWFEVLKRRAPEEE